MEIAGRTALVTGAGIGTGRAIAVALAAEGADVVASDVDEAGGNETVAMCEGNARFVHADLTVAAEVGRLIDVAAPTILVNNPGGGGHIPPMRLPTNEPRRPGSSGSPRRSGGSTASA